MQVGYHVSRKEVKDAPSAIKLACESIKTYGFAPSLQIFATGPQSSRILFDDTILANIKTVIDEHNALLFIHGAYIDTPWSKSNKACDNIVREMKMAKTCGAKGVVVHLSKEAHGENLKWVLNYVNDKIHHTDVILYLEVNTAKSSPFTFETPEKLHALFNTVSTIQLDYQVGLCLDTAHLFSCGTPLSHISDSEPWFKKLMEGLDRNIPLMIHLNDSRSTLGSGKDQHQQLCLGAIWDKLDDDCGLKSVLEWTQAYDVPIILERDENADATNDLQIIQTWHDTGNLM